MKPVFAPGDTFHGYVVERQLGAGGLGTVWLARHAVLDAPFAIKVLDRGLAREKGEDLRRFVREAKLATQIKHPNLVAVHDVGYDSARDIHYIVMDYVSGETLRVALAMGGPLSADEAAGIVLQVAGVLDAARHFGMVHRDLKPENVMITPDGTAKLLDLGVAKVSRRVDSLRTVAATVFGTPDYIAPEQAVDSSLVDPRADIYALGVILFEMLAGRRPYLGDTPTEILRQLLDAAPVPDVRTFAPSVPPALAALVAKMCAKDPDARFATPREMIDAFAAAGYRAAKAVSAAPADAGPGGQRSMGELLARAAQADAPRGATGLTQGGADDPELAAFLARRRRRRVWRILARAAVWAAVAAACAFAAWRASAETVSAADCVRDQGRDVWASPDVTFGVAVVKDVCAHAGLDLVRVPFRPDGQADFDGAEVICAAFRTPELLKRYDFPVQPLGRMHFALYATPERAKRMMSVKITDWPRMRVGYSPVALGRDRDRERYFEHATLSPEFVEFPTSAGAVAALRADEVDALFLYTPLGRRPEGLVEVVPIGDRNVYFAVRRDRPDLLRTLSASYRTCYIENIERYDAWREELLGVPRPAKRVRVAAYSRGHLFDVTPDGVRSGIVPEWLTAIAAGTHWTLDYVYGDYDESLRDVMSGRLDVIGGIGFSAQRGEQFLFPHTPIGMLRVYLWTHPGSRFQPGDPSTWEGMKLGILSGTLSALRVRQQLEEHPLDITCVEYDSDRELNAAYFSGAVDACVNIETPALDREVALHIYASHPMYICASPARRDLLFELETALDAVCDDFPKYMRMITERHYGVRSEMSVLSLAEVEWLRERAKDPTPVYVDFSPWPVPLVGPDGRAAGFAGALLAELSEKTGLDFRPQAQTGIQTAEARFMRGDTALWIPYPEHADCAAYGGVSVFALPVPKSYAAAAGVGPGRGDLEMWAHRSVPDELVSIVRKTVVGLEHMHVQEMFMKAAAEHNVVHRVFGLTDEELRRLVVAVGFAVLSAVALFGVVMALLLRHQVKRASAAAKVAEEYSRAKTRFLAMMSHELRTPLNAVIGFSEFLARDDCDAERRREYITGIQLSANAQLDLINDILDLSKLDTGAMHMRTGECDVGRVAGEMPAIFSYRVRRSGVPLVVRRVSAAEVPVLRLSQQGFKQLLINLVGNAVKFTERGEIAVEYGWDPARAALTLVVRDTGCGISAAKMARLFDPFVQDIASRMKHADGEQRGTGLGLPIVKRMVDNAGGTVSVASEPGKGTAFTIVIPSLEVVRAASHHEAPPPVALPGRILVVDDMAINRKVLGIHLKNLGVADVRFAENGVAACAVLRDWKPDVVLTDMWMPEMDGQQLAAAMKADPSLAGIPVMAITADVDVASTYDMSGFAKVIAKPVTSEKLRGLFA